MPGVFMSTMKHEMPSCFGLSGSVRARQMPQCGVLRAIDVHTFWPFSTQPPSTRVARVDRRREVGAGAGLAEQLAPDDLAAQRRQDPALLLLLRAVHDEVRQRPRADHDPRPRDLRGAELLLDHEQLERVGVATPRPRPRRRDVARRRRAACAARRPARSLISARNARSSARMRLGFGAGGRRRASRRPPRHRGARGARSATRPASRRAGAASSRAAGRCARRAPT